MIFIRIFHLFDLFWLLRQDLRIPDDNVILKAILVPTSATHLGGHVVHSIDGIESCNHLAKGRVGIDLVTFLEIELRSVDAGVVLHVDVKVGPAGSAGIAQGVLSMGEVGRVFLEANAGVATLHKVLAFVVVFEKFQTSLARVFVNNLLGMDVGTVA